VRNILTQKRPFRIIYSGASVIARKRLPLVLVQELEFPGFHPVRFFKFLDPGKEVLNFVRIALHWSDLPSGLAQVSYISTVSIATMAQ
jgi:hypothetical protein